MKSATQKHTTVPMQWEWYKRQWKQ